MCIIAQVSKRCWKKLMVLGNRAHRTVVQAERLQTSNGITLIDNLYCTFEI